MSKRPIGFIKPQIFENVLQQLISVGIKSVGLHTIVETFMNNMESLLEIANHYNFYVWISTNAQFPSRIEQIYNEFPSLEYTYRFSIDGATKKSYESIRSGVYWIGGKPTNYPSRAMIRDTVLRAKERNITN
tara:strand:+ start:34 stop:429 length:396 start_codon:yes stop_codon:yes gene_type:complete